MKKLAKIGNRKHRALAEEISANLEAAKVSLLQSLKRIVDPTAAALLHEVSHNLRDAIGLTDEILTLINQGDADELTRLVEELDERNRQYVDQMAVMERRLDGLAREVAEFRQAAQNHRRTVAVQRERAGD